VRLLASSDLYKQLVKVNGISNKFSNLDYNAKGVSSDTYLMALLRDTSVDKTSSKFERTFRSGYQTIRSDIGSQRRLRVTKGIYLPADIPLHGIFGSKDVIHS
jgi:hypothetical protein